MTHEAPPGREQRPGSDRALDISTTAIAEDVSSIAPAEDIVRCATCGHVLWSDLSVMLGIGPECRRRAA